MPTKPVAPVSSTRSRGRLPSAASRARACFCSSATRAFTSRSERWVGSRNWNSVVARGDADQPLHAGRVGRVSGQARHGAAEASPQGLDALQPGLDEPLVAGHVDQPAREELGRDLHRVAVAVSVHQEIGRLDRVADGLAGGAVQLDDVLARRHVDARADLRRDRLSSAGHGTREPTPWGERSQRC